MVLTEVYFLLVITGGAALLPMASRMLRLPAAVTEIVFGIVIGTSLLGLQAEGDWLSFLAELGFWVLMFHAGMEIDFAMLREQGRRDLMFYLGVFALTLGLSLTFAHIMGYGVFMALVLTTTSLGLVMPTLKEQGLTKTPMGQAILISATLADFLTLLGITVFLLWREYGFGVRLFYPLPLFAGFFFVLRAARLWAWWRPDQAEKLLGPRDHRERGVRLSLAVLVVFVALSELVHLEPALGAFLGGAVLSYAFRERGVLEDKLSALGFGFLIPVFFIHVGMQFNLANVLKPDQLLLTLTLLGLAFLVKVLPSLLFAARGVAPREAFNAGILLSARLSLIVAAASLGVRQGLITPEMRDSVILLALVTCLAGPTIFKALAGAPPETPD